MKLIDGQSSVYFILDITVLISGATAFPNAQFGQGTGPIAYNNLLCTGGERRLVDCPSDGYGVIGSCTHSDDASVSCQEGTLFH